MAAVVSTVDGREYGDRKINPGVVVRRGDETYIVIRLNRLDGNDGYCVYDESMYDTFSMSSWCLSNGYTAMTGGGPYMHHSLGIDRAPELSIDHMNWMKTDNRMANIRVATQAQQNSNRKERSDCVRNEPPPALVAAGVTSLPRGMRYDAGEGKFVFADHPLVRTGAWTTSATGTKSTKLTILERFHNCLESYIDMLRANHVGEDPAFVARRIALGREYNDIVTAAFQGAAHIFEAPPQLADIDLLTRDDLAEAVAIKARVFGAGSAAPAGGPKTKEYRDIDLPSLDAVMRIKGDDVFLFDARHKRALADINFDVTWKADGKTIARYGVDKKTKLNLSDFVFRVLEENAVPDGHSVVNYSKITRDVRMENLLVRQGTNKIGRVSSSRTPEAVRDIVGADYIPLGVKIENNSRGTDFKLDWNERAKKFAKIKTHADYESKVIAMLRQWYSDDGLDFDAEHAKFVKLISSYDAAVAIAV